MPVTWTCPCGTGRTLPDEPHIAPRCPKCGLPMLPGLAGVRIEPLPDDCLPPGVRIAGEAAYLDRVLHPQPAPPPPAEEEPLEIDPEDLHGRPKPASLCPWCEGPTPCRRYACVEAQAAQDRAAEYRRGGVWVPPLHSVAAEDAYRANLAADVARSDAERQHEQALLDAFALALAPGCGPV